MNLENISMEFDEEKGLKALRGVIDPELGVDIVSLGLVYGIDVTADTIHLRMTLTTPGCPLSGVIAMLAKKSLEDVAEGRAVEVDLVWNPPWTPDRIAPEARERLRRK